MTTQLRCEETKQWKTILPKSKHYATTDMDGEFAPRTFWFSELGINGDGWSISQIALSLWNGSLYMKMKGKRTHLLVM